MKRKRALVCPSGTEVYNPFEVNTSASTCIRLLNAVKDETVAEEDAVQISCGYVPTKIGLSSQLYIAVQHHVELPVFCGKTRIPCLVGGKS